MKRLLSGLLVLILLSASNSSHQKAAEDTGEPGRNEPVQGHDDANSGSIASRLRKHVEHLSLTIGPRSIYEPGKLEETADYIEESLSDYGLPVSRQIYSLGNIRFCNVLASLGPPEGVREYLIGAHYDTVIGTPGADDNASAVAVLLETASAASGLSLINNPVRWTFAAFTLEEPPTFGSHNMGSRHFVRQTKKEDRPLVGSLVLEMVGYYSDAEGSQFFPFPLHFFGYPKKGDFIGLVANCFSRPLLRDLEQSFSKNTGLPFESLTVPGRGGLLPMIRFSDHASFWDAGFQSIMITDTAFYRNPNYHTVNDLPDTLDFERMALLVESLLLFIKDISKLP